MKATIVKRCGFDAAHFLPYYVGKCKNLHGHHWVVELGIVGEVMEEHGMVTDFSKLKSYLDDYVVSEFDHTLLNDKLGNPTAENLALYIRETFNESGWIISGDIRLEFIRVWETEDSYVEVKG